MSSTTNTFSTPTSTADAGGGDDGSLAQRGANYFFGFLITFVVLLLVFVGCGIGTRRRYLARRQAALFGNLDPWGSPYPTVEQKEPLLYEHHIGEPRLDDKWVCTKVSGIQYSLSILYKYSPAIRLHTSSHYL